MPMHALKGETYQSNSPLRIAILPMPGHTYFPGETEFLMFRQFARDVRDWYGVFSYILLPEIAKKQIRPEPGIRIIFEGPFECFHDGIVQTPTTFLELFNPRDGKYPVDLVITSRGASGATLQRALRDYRSDIIPLTIYESSSDGIPLVIDESMPADFGWKANPSLDWTELTSRVCAYATAARTYFDTERERQVALNSARRVLSAQMLKDLESKMEAMPYGFSTDFVEECTRGVNRRDRFTVFMGSRHNIDKRWDRILAIYNRFFAFGRDVGIVITAPKLENVSALPIVQSNEAIEVTFECAQPDFIRKAAECHAALWMSKVEGLAVGFLQQAYCGLILLLPRKADWVKEILREKYADYPFLFTRDKEAERRLRWIYENYEEAKKLVEWMPQWIKDTYGSQTCTRKAYESMRDGIIHPKAPCRLWTKSNVELFIAVSAALPDEFTFDEAVDKCFSMSQQLYRDMRDPRRGKPSRWSLWKWLKGPGGYVDTCKAEFPIFAKDPNFVPGPYSDMQYFKYREEHVCPKCGGRGFLDKAREAETRCPQCDGSGEMLEDESVW